MFQAVPVEQTLTDKLWRNRLQFKIGLTLILLATLILAGFGLYQYAILRVEKLASLTYLADSTIERLAHNLAVPLWNYDLDLVAQTIRSEMKEKNVIGIVVTYTANFITDSREPEVLAAITRDADGQSILTQTPVGSVGLLNSDGAASSATPPPPRRGGGPSPSPSERGPGGEVLQDMRRELNSPAVGSGDLVRRAAILYEGATLGQVDIALTRRFITIELARQLRNLIIQILALDLALFAFLGFTLGRLLVKPITRLAINAHAIANGDFEQVIAVRQNDEIGRFAEAFQRMQMTIRQVFQDIERLTQAIASGDLDSRGQADAFDGGWRELVLGVNRTVDAFVTPFKVTAEYIDRMAVGALPEEISGQDQGDFNALRDNLNKLTHALETTITMAEAVAGGNFNVNVAERSADDRMMRALNQMTTQLRLRTKQLQQQTRELTAAKDRALEAQKAAEVANRAKSEFLSKMSHELRTPLNGVLGYAQILSHSHNLTPSQRNGLQIIQQSGEHLLTLINDILDLAKIEARKLELYPAPLKLRPFLDGVAGIMLMRAQQKGLRLRFECPPDLPARIEADETRLRQVLLNLLGNAVKFTEPGGAVTFTVRSPRLSEHATSAEALTTNLHFEISDTGVGMTTEQMATIFRPFEQVGDLQQRAAGTGLGLAISQQLVELMGGQIHVESASGQGSTFWFEAGFPVLEQQDEGGGGSHKRLIGYAGERRTALVVDDIEPNRLVLRDMLRELGFEVALAADGDEGVAQARQTRPDIIFTDLVMPRKTGFELVQELRQEPEFQDTVIIAVSASVVKTDQRRSRFVGCNAFLPKPVNADKLAYLLQQHLACNWRYADEAESSAEPTGASHAIVPPPPAEFDALYEQAWLGFMNEVILKANEIETIGEEYAPFARRVKQFAEQCEEQQLLAWLNQFVDRAATKKIIY